MRSDKDAVITGHDSCMDPLTTIAWALIPHIMPDGRTWTVREQAAEVLNFIHGNGYIVIKQKEVP